MAVLPVLKNIIAMKKKHFLVLLFFLEEDFFMNYCINFFNLKDMYGKQG